LGASSADLPWTSGDPAPQKGRRRELEAIIVDWMNLFGVGNTAKVARYIVQKKVKKSEKKTCQASESSINGDTWRQTGLNSRSKKL
jgi:hypothetical protein